MKTFPDLQNWEDSKTKIEKAHSMISLLKEAVSDINQEIYDEAEIKEKKSDTERKLDEVRNKRQLLETLNSRFEKLVQQIGTQEGGYSFSGCNVFPPNIEEFLELLHKYGFKDIE